MRRNDDVELVDAALVSLFQLALSRRVHATWVGDAEVHLSRAGLRVLSLVAHSDLIGVGEVAEALDMSIATASRQVAQLEQSGLLERRPDESDRRATRLTLTEHGHAVRQRIKDRRERDLESVLSIWGVNDRHKFARLFSQFVDELTKAGSTHTSI